MPSDFDACRFDFRLDTKKGLTPSRRRRVDSGNTTNNNNNNNSAGDERETSVRPPCSVSTSGSPATSSGVSDGGEQTTFFACKLCGCLLRSRAERLTHTVAHADRAAGNGDAGDGGGGKRRKRNRRRNPPPPPITDKWPEINCSEEPLALRRFQSTQMTSPTLATDIMIMPSSSDDVTIGEHRLPLSVTSFPALFPSDYLSCVGVSLLRDADGEFCDDSPSDRKQLVDSVSGLSPNSSVEDRSEGFLYRRLEDRVDRLGDVDRTRDCHVMASQNENVSKQQQLNSSASAIQRYFLALAARTNSSSATSEPRDLPDKTQTDDGHRDDTQRTLFGSADTGGSSGVGRNSSDVVVDSVFSDTISPSESNQSEAAAGDNVLDFSLKKCRSSTSPSAGHDVTSGDEDDDELTSRLVIDDADVEDDILPFGTDDPCRQTFLREQNESSSSSACRGAADEFIEDRTSTKQQRRNKAAELDRMVDRLWQNKLTCLRGFRDVTQGDEDFNGIAQEEGHTDWNSADDKVARRSLRTFNPICDSTFSSQFVTDDRFDDAESLNCDAAVDDEDAGIDVDAGPAKLLLRKVVAAPGSHPQFYTSLMRLQSSRRKTAARRKQTNNCFQPASTQSILTPDTCDNSFSDLIPSDAFPSPPDDDVTTSHLPMLVCSVCGQSAVDGDELLSHVLSTHGSELSELRGHVCSTCGRRFSSASSVAHHFARKHAVGGRHMSRRERRRTKVARNLQATQETESLEAVVPPDVIAVPSVDASQSPVTALLLDNSSLAQYIVINSPSPMLPATLAAPASVTQVLVAPTTSQVVPAAAATPTARDVACDFPGCRRTFRELKHLKVHRMQHTDERPLACELCSYACRQRNSLNWHMKSRHGLRNTVTEDGRTIYV